MEKKELCVTLSRNRGFGFELWDDIVSMESARSVTSVQGCCTPCSSYRKLHKCCDWGLYTWREDKACCLGVQMFGTGIQHVPITAWQAAPAADMHWLQKPKASSLLKEKSAMFFPVSYTIGFHGTVNLLYQCLVQRCAMGRAWHQVHFQIFCALPFCW